MERKADPKIKLRLLYNAYPWLRQIEDEIGTPEKIKVHPLDANVIVERFVGVKRGKSAPENCWVGGYAFDVGGHYLRELHKRPSLVELFLEYWIYLRTFPDYTTLEGLLRGLPAPDEVRAIALIEGINSWFPSKLHLLMVPDGKTLTELLIELKHDRQMDALHAEQVARKELEDEIKKLK